MKDWFIIYDKGKDKYFAIEDKHNGVMPKMVGNMEVVGVCAFNQPQDAIHYVEFISSEPQMRRRLNA